MKLNMGTANEIITECRIRDLPYSHFKTLTVALRTSH